MVQPSALALSPCTACSLPLPIFMVNDQPDPYNFRDHRQIHAIREALNQELVLGREDFKDKIERMSKRQVRPGQPGRPRVEEEQAVYYVL
jgi:hypothetical protein